VQYLGPLDRQINRLCMFHCGVGLGGSPVLKKCLFYLALHSSNNTIKLAKTFYCILKKCCLFIVIMSVLIIHMLYY
jgi:hypothetical protein